MAFRLYLVPKVQVLDTFVPKYFGDDTLSVAWSGIDYDDWYLVGADLSAGDHTAVAGEPDAMALPADLSATLTAGQVTTVQTRMEAANLPAGWVDTSVTWRQVMRVVCGMMQLTQRFRGKHRAGFWGGGITLNSTVGDLSPTARQRLQEAAESMGLDVAGVTLATTLRAVLKNLGTQLQDRPITLGTLTL